MRRCREERPLSEWGIQLGQSTHYRVTRNGHPVGASIYGRSAAVKQATRLAVAERQARLRGSDIEVIIGREDVLPV